MSKRRMGLLVLDIRSFGKHLRLKRDEYIHVDIPRLYWTTLLALLGIGIVSVGLSAAATAILGLEWVNTGEENWTLFELGSTVAFFLFLIGSLLLILGLAIFSYSIRSKKPKQ